MTVTAVKLRQHDAAMHADVLRVVGYRASCRWCAWIGSVRKSYADARVDVAEHACEAKR